MLEILLATGNPGKAREMLEILGRADAHHAVTGRVPSVRWRFLKELESAGWPEPVEDGDTFLVNAEIKARHYARLSGMWTVADDSGLVVDVLNGEPGVRSARYAGEPKSDQTNNRLLIQRLGGVPAERRTARFCCVVVLSDAARTLASAEGTVEGLIVDEPRGTNGFGYDPHFWVPSVRMTTAEMSPDVKHAISHRGQALRRLRERLPELLQSAAVPEE